MPRDHRRRGRRVRPGPSVLAPEEAGGEQQGGGEQRGEGADDAHALAVERSAPSGGASTCRGRRLTATIRGASNAHAGVSFSATTRVSGPVTDAGLPRCASLGRHCPAPWVVSRAPPLAASSAVVELVLHYRKVARHALNVLLGAVEIDPATSAIPCTPAEGVGALTGAIDSARAAGRTPVVAWSFYSAGFAAVAEELRAVRRRCGTGRSTSRAGRTPAPRRRRCSAPGSTWWWSARGR